MKVKNITLAALALLLAACGNEEIIENNGTGNAEKVPMTFTAGIPQTRTSLAEDGYAVNWTTGDRVAIYDGTAELCEFEATEIDGNTATLSGDAASADTYTAFYPFETVTTLTDKSVTFTLTAAQTAVAGSFNEKLNPSWAQDTDGSHKLKFQNLCALAKFTVGIDGVTEVVLTANGDDDALAGSLTYTIAEDKLAAAEEGASRSVTLTGTFESGKTYYFVVAPGTLVGGITLRYMGGDGKTYVKTTQKEVTFTAGEIADLGNVATDGFSEALNPAFAAAIMDYNNISLTANPDGTASLTDANKQQMEALTVLYVNECSLTSLAGIEYFTNLKQLYCHKNDLTTLDVSKLTSLTGLYCNNNSLESLDVSMLTNLTDLNCNNNSLESLDVSALTRLTYLDCSGNSLESLDVSMLTSLTRLYCNDNGLTTLSLPTTSTLTNLECHNNALTALDVNKLTGLTSLTCYNNQMTALDITQNTVLEDLYCGQQKKGETDLKLVLTLTDDQEIYWDAVWNEWPENSGVEINSQSTSASATNISFAGGSKVVW